MNVYESFFHIKAMIFDIDGVFTNNEILVTEHGEFLRSMNVKDGYAVKRAIRSGFKIAIISGGQSEGTRKRFELLGLTEIFLGVEDKLSCYNNLVSSWSISSEHIAYMGDDLPDLEVMKQVGLACCPQDAVPEILEISGFISTLNGGKGCVRDLIEKIMQAQDKW